MLKDAPVQPTIPVTDLERAKSFYSKRLGLEADQEVEDHVIYRCGGNTRLTVFQRATPTSGEHTAASFEVEDLDAVVQELEAAGITFETFPEMPGVEIDGAIHTYAGADIRGSWVKDPDGNLIAISEIAD